CWSSSTRAAASTDCWRGSTVAEPLLRIEDLAKHFGGVVASDNITLDVAEGELHAIIRPNGAGKTTPITQPAGEITPDAGRVIFAGEEITQLSVPRRSALGLARSFQISSLFPDFTALDNVALAVQAHAGHSFHFWQPARGATELREPARAALGRVGLGARADTLVARLSHGAHRARGRVASRGRWPGADRRSRPAWSSFCASSSRR